MASIRDESGYNQGFQETAAYKIRLQRRASEIIKEIDSDGDVIEVGCGTGELSYLIGKEVKNKIYGIDVSNKFIIIAVEKYKLANIQYNCCESQELLNRNANIQPKFFIGNGVLHHMYYNLESELRAMYDIIGVGGKIVFLEPNLYNPYVFLIFTFSIFRKLARLDPKEMAFSKNHVQQILKNCNYKSIQVNYIDFLLPNTPKSLIKLVIKMEKIIYKYFPFLKFLSQSLLIVAKK